MANICYALHKEIDEKLVEVVVVPETVVAGNVLVAEALVAGSTTVYAGTKVADITAEKPLIIIDQGFEELEDGRRPDGSNMVTDIKFVAGKRVHAIRFDQDMKYEIATDVIETTITPVVGKFLIPQNGSLELAVADTLGTALVGFKIEAVSTIPVGGNVMAGFTASVIARIVLA